MKKGLTLLCFAAIASAAVSQNPYMPLWEFIPDGEPYVFEDPDKPGEYRVYVYGSHDNLVTAYCGRDQVAWSAPVDNLTDWRFDGIIFRVDKAADGTPIAEVPDVLYAPDVVEVMENGNKVYYLCPNDQVGGRRNLIAKSSRPDGPFEVCNWKEDGRTTFGVFDFDPAIFCDDDGRVYGYWGFEHSMAAELDPATMCTVKPGTKVIEDMISGRFQEGDFRFFEASSMRKVDGMYVFVYSRFTGEGEFGLPSRNYSLAYAYSDSPLGPWTYGGTIIDARARDFDEAGNVICTAYPYGNTHGSICKIKDQWYVFYHRQTGTDEFARQAMVAPIDVKVQNGKVTISEAEYTSEGFQIDGLNPLHRQPAGIACYMTHPAESRQEYPNMYFTGSYIGVVRPMANGLNESYSLNWNFSPVVNNTDGSTIGYKYFNFDYFNGSDTATLIISMLPHGVEGDIVILAGSPYASRGGREIGRLHLAAGNEGETCNYEIPVNGLSQFKGKQGLYMQFVSDTKGKSLCDLYNFIFKL